MNNKDVNPIQKELQKIPGVGPKISKVLYNLEITSISDLKNKNPEILYQQLNSQVGYKVDRCVLYVFRCAVYFASNKTYDPELLKWWNWKDS
jgi:predicted RecB family nuclease